MSKGVATKPFLSSMSAMYKCKSLNLIMNYLDINKSVIISSPAGSGKTEKLARRYIALLKSDVDVERILAITFTDKAAAEMKQRILRILKEEEEGLFKKVIDKVSLMRVSTIHSFCGTLLRRFSFEASVSPNYKVEDAIDSRIIWEEILYEILMEEGRENQKSEERHKLILQTISEKGFRGLEELKSTINYLYEKSPFSLEVELPDFPESPHSPLWEMGVGGDLKVGIGELIEGLKNWPGAEKAIDDYKKVFEDNTKFLRIENYFLTDIKTSRKRMPPSLKGIVDFQGWAEKMHRYWIHKNMEEGLNRARRIIDIFRRCYEIYRNKKALKGVLDFSDLEYLAYKLLTEDPEWANVLYAFDEKTDHILVDEFQDTNNFQWAIIDRLTEEWRAGIGAKRGEGVKPTIFLVGDEKQSIYFFRGANVEIFGRAKDKFMEWLKEEFYYEEVKENFRSLPQIVDFTNYVFSKIMTADESSPSWRTRYIPLVPARSIKDTKGRLKSADKGCVDPVRCLLSNGVEIILFEKEDKEPVSKVKQREADIIAKRIQSLIGGLEITDRKTNLYRTCKYMDIAILLRKRIHLKKYEEALRQNNIPFVVVKGIGFYQEPEVAMLRAFVYFLSNPKDDYSLYMLLRSPLFMIDEGTIIKAVNSEGDCLFSKLKSICAKEGRGGLTGLSLQLYSEMAVEFLEECLSQLPHTALSELIENTLVKTRAWEYFYETQRRANIKKFIRIIEDLEANGKSLFKVRDFLERTYNKEEEPKANVNTEGMDAVKIMTIHASKGLEFPVVFVPGIEEPFTLRTDESLIYEAEGRLFFKYVSDAAIRRVDNDFLLHSEKEREEQKRLFYVAVTRAENMLFLCGCWNDKDNNSFLTFLKQGLGLKKDKEYHTEATLEGLSIRSEEEIKALYEKSPIPKAEKRVHSYRKFIPLETGGSPEWRSVTEAVNISRRHGKEWLIIGDVMHRIFEEISKGILNENGIRLKAARLLTSKGVTERQGETFLSIIEKDIQLLKQKGIWQNIILPRESSYSELPFILESEGVIYTGRIDRIIVKDESFNIYDYKTFPVEEKEMEYLLKEYSFQLNIYKKAVGQLFKAKDVKAFIVFTHIGELREI